MKHLLHNLSRPVVWLCHHVPHIPGVHRRHVHVTAGLTVAIGGVLLTKCVHEPFALHIVADFVGYALHAIGLAPLFKSFNLD